MKEPNAKLSYFFGRCYADVFVSLWDVWKSTFGPFIEEFARLQELMQKSVFLAVLVAICDLFGFPISAILLFVLDLVFSIGYFCFLLVFPIFYLLGILFFYLVDLIYRKVKGIGNNCPNPDCQQKFSLPMYVCPQCGRQHRRLYPNLNGIFKHVCQCGRDLQTTFVSKGACLDALCPHCSSPIVGKYHVDIAIPVVGGPSAGKTCFLTMAISQIESMAKQHRLAFRFSQTEGCEYLNNKQIMEKNGWLPQKTSDLSLQYYQFYLTQNGSKLENLISVCDVAGETYENLVNIKGQMGFTNANGFIILVDPLSIKNFRPDVPVNFDAYHACDREVDEVFDLIVQQLESVAGKTSGVMKDKDVAVVFTKCDLGIVDKKIGKSAIREYAKTHSGCTYYQAQNEVCKKFLIEYGEDEFLNELYEKAKSVQFFTCSALGHVAGNGMRFKPVGVAEPVLWIIDKASKNIDLNKVWKKKV